MTDPAPIPLAPERISVSDGRPGHFDLLHPLEEQTQFIVQIDEHRVSCVVDTDLGSEMDELSWQDRIAAVVQQKKTWIMPGAQAAAIVAIEEWLARDDDEDESRLTAIEVAEENERIRRLLAPLRDLGPSELRRIITELVEIHNGHHWLTLGVGGGKIHLQGHLAEEKD